MSRIARCLRAIPLPFWLYTLPMLWASLGWIPHRHPFYTFSSQQLLPVCLVLLLIGTDLKGLVRLGPLAAALMLAGSLGTMLGGWLSFQFYRPWLPEGSWAALGALSASWIGGSINLLAVKEALHVEDNLIGPVILVDALVAYSWMALLILSAGWQGRWNRRMGISTESPLLRGGPSGTVRPPQRGGLTLALASGCALPASKVLGATMPAQPSEVPSGPTPRGVTAPLLTPHPLSALLLGILLSVLVSLAAQWAGSRLPTMGQVLNPQSWTILIVTTTALILSLTPLAKLEEAGLSRIGTLLLYLLLVTIGARADVRAMVDTPLFLGLGVTWILCHGAFLFTAGWLLKAPLGLIATASQANIGGPVSAPIVGATFSSPYASVGLLMAILGNLLGTYLGLLTAFAIRP